MNDMATLKPDSGATIKLRSLRARMMVYFGLTFAMGIFAVDMSGLYGVPFTDYRGEHGKQRDEAYRELAVFADVAKAEVLHLVRERRDDAVIFCESPVLRKLVARAAPLARSAAGLGKGASGAHAALLRSADCRSLTGHLSTIKETHAALYERIYLADAATGTVIASTDERDVGRNISTSPFFQEMREGVEDENIGSIPDSQSGATTIAIYRTVRDMGKRGGGEDAVAAILFLNLKPDLFIRSLEVRSEGLGKTGEIYLVDEEKKLLSRLNRSLRNGTVARPLETRIETRAATLAVEGNEGVIAVEDYAGVPVLAAFRHLRLNSETALGMVVKIDRSEVFAKVSQMALYAAYKAVFLCLLGLGVTYAIATRLSRPIKALSRTARKVEEGDLSARAPAEGSDEVGALARSFNSMVQRIQNWHNELEGEVRTRTAELTALNRDLSGEVAERRRAEEALRASELRFREMLETVHQVAVILDTKGRITFCNDFLLNLTDRARDEVLGQSWFDIFLADEEREGVRAMFIESLASGDLPDHYENPIVTRSGARRAIVWDNTLLRSADGGVIGTASLGRDVTEQLSLEEQLRQSQKMEAVGQLAGGVAHDFNNLLTVIIGNCELIRLKTGEDNPANRYVQQILQVSDKAARLTRSLLAFSRKQLLSVEAVDVNACVTGVASLLERVIGEDIEFRVGLTGAKLPVMADRDQLEQVLVNLATNARDAMTGGGDLLIETRRADLDMMSARLHGLEEAGAYAVIQVSDTGSGMDEVTQGKIFEPFFTTKEVGKGTGLGLAMVFGTIRQHGGYIDVYSEVGKGTVFKIYLPLVHAETVEQDLAAQEPVTPGGSETVLVVEDNEDVLEMTASILAQFGYRVIKAADGEEAVARFSENRDSVGLVILDVIMPKMNGKEVYDILRQIRPDTKALFTSGYTADILNRKVMMEEGLHLLQKPVSPRELLQKVRELLDNG